MRIKVTFISISLILMCSMGACSYCNRQLGLDEDHFLEEAGEAVIKDQLGIDIDLTPGSPE